MPISISVVGIFFGAELDFNSDMQVIDVLSATNAAAKAGSIKNVSAFNYELTAAPNIVATSFTAVYTGEVKGRGIEKTYSPGEYFLPENLNLQPAYSVWQYYVLDAQGVSTTGGSVRFLDKPDAKVPSGGKLIWRLVSILGGPNSVPRIAAARQRQAA